MILFVTLDPPIRILFMAQYNNSNIVTNPYIIIKQYDLNSVDLWVNYTYTRHGFVAPVLKWYVGNETFKDAYNTNFGKTWHGKILKATVTNMFGSASIEKRIVFFYGPTIISPKFYQNFQARGNTNFSVTVTYEGRPAVNRISWDHKDIVIPNEVGDTLNFVPMSRSDRGQYGVRVTNSENRSYRSVFTVDVHIPPTITDIAIDGTRLTSGDILTYGKTIKLEIMVKSDTAAPYRVQCKVGENVIYKGSNLTTDITIGAWHGKQLTCMVSNEHGIGSISRKVVFSYQEVATEKSAGLGLPILVGSIGGAVVLVVVVAIVVVCCVTKKYRTKRNTGAEGHVSYDNRGRGFEPDMHGQLLTEVIEKDRRDRPTPPAGPPEKMDWPTLHDSVYLEPETPENDYQLLRISLPALPTYEEFEPDEKI